MTISEFIKAITDVGFLVNAGLFIETLELSHITEYGEQLFMEVNSAETDYIFSFAEESGRLTKEESRSLTDILEEYRKTPVEARFNQKNRSKTVVIDKGDSFIVRARYDISWRQAANAYGGRWNRIMKGWEFDRSQKSEIGLLLQSFYNENPFPEKDDDWEHYTNSQYIRLRQDSDCIVLETAYRDKENIDPERTEQILIAYGDQLENMTQTEIDETIKKWETKKRDWIKTGLFKEYPN